MKKLTLFAAPLLLAASVAFAAGDDYTSARSIDTSEWSGVPVMNSQGATVGTYYRQVQSSDGQVDYIIIQSSDPAQTMYAVPSNYVQVNPTDRNLLMDLDPMTLSNAPTYMDNTDVNDEAFIRDTEEFYGTYAHDYGGFGAVESDRSEPANDMNDNIGGDATGGAGNQDNQDGTGTGGGDTGGGDGGATN